MRAQLFVERHDDLPEGAAMSEASLVAALRDVIDWYEAGLLFSDPLSLLDDAIVDWSILVAATDAQDVQTEAALTKPKRISIEQLNESRHYHGGPWYSPCCDDTFLKVRPGDERSTIIACANCHQLYDWGERQKKPSGA